MRTRRVGSFPAGWGHPATPHRIEQGASVYEALRGLTTDAARAIGADEVQGSLEVAKVADLVLLSDDPRAVAPEEVANIAVVATIRVVRTTAEPEDEG